MSAQRFGGRFSPSASRGSAGSADGAPSPAMRPARRGWRRVSIRAVGLGVAATPLLFAAFGRFLSGDLLGLAAMGGAYAAFLFGAALTGAGMIAASEYDARAVASPPAFPRKLAGAGSTALGVALAGYFGWGLDLVETAGFAAIAALLHVFVFRPDPMRAKGVDGLKGEALDAAVARIETARALISEMTGAASGLGDPALARTVADVAAEAEAVVAMVERDPGDLRRARRLLAVYLVGARDATVRYAQTVEGARDAAAREAFIGTMGDLAEHMRRNRKAVEGGERVALDVEIDVLRDRLRMESGALR